jgi:hypothetical protein
VTLPTYDECVKTSIDRAPFSNGDEGYGWMYNWCDRCVNDAEQHGKITGPGCPIIAVAFFESRTPAEWLDQKRLTPDGRMYERYGIADQYHCMYFRNEDQGGGDGEPKPIPDPPGQLTLVPREPYEQTRMLTTYPTPVEVAQ